MGRNGINYEMQIATLAKEKFWFLRMYFCTSLPRRNLSRPETGPHISLFQSPSNNQAQEKEKQSYASRVCNQDKPEMWLFFRKRILTMFVIWASLSGKIFACGCSIPHWFCATGSRNQPSSLLPLKTSPNRGFQHRCVSTCLLVNGQIGSRTSYELQNSCCSNPLYRIM